MTVFNQQMASLLCKHMSGEEKTNCLQTNSALLHMNSHFRKVFKNDVTYKFLAHFNLIFQGLIDSMCKNSFACVESS
jgi:hypothetical protein